VSDPDEFAAGGRSVTLARSPPACNRQGVANELTEDGQDVPEAESRLKQLMLLSLGGDAAAYRMLLADLSTRLRAYYRRRLGSASSDAEDLVQETLIAMHERRITFDRTQPLTAWVYAIARYKLIDHLRRRRVHATLSVDDCTELFAPDDVEQASASQDVAKLLSKLPEATSEAIRLTKLEGHSIEEAAERTGKSATATKVSIHRGLLRLTQWRGGKPDADE
jgi:RNA polymerase sigma factor (sigma-70 family)